MGKPKVLVIVGPNASGKSTLGVVLARKFNGEIISADSRQIYKGLDLGSGKITERERRGIPHHLLDIASPKRTFTVVQYQTRAKKVLEDITKRGKLPIIVGGTGFYIDALIYDVNFPPARPQSKLHKTLEKLNTEELFQHLKRLDPRRAATIDSRNRRRLIRAIEIIETTGRPIVPLKKSSPYRVLKIGLRLPTSILKKRISDRLKRRLKAGMIDEVKKLQRKGLSRQRLDELGLEYRYLARYLQGLSSYEEMVQKLKTEIWHYARRQLTWFRKDKRIHWIGTPKEAEKLVEQFLK